MLELLRLPANGLMSLKSEKAWLALGNSCALGTVTAGDVIPCLTLRPSYDVKKKVRSFLIGPPNVPPNDVNAGGLGHFEPVVGSRLSGAEPTSAPGALQPLHGTSVGGEACSE